MDEIGHFFALRHDHVLPDQSGVGVDRGGEAEALLLQASALANTASTLKSTRKECSTKWEALKQRRRDVKSIRERLESNHEKYKFFVMEKSQKVKEGERVAREQKRIVDNIEENVKQEQNRLKNLQRLKILLEKSLEERACFKQYLENVIKAQPNPRYRDINELMRRCETLVQTRDQWRTEEQRLNSSIEEQNKCLAQIKEEHNETLLNLYARQSGLQEQLHDIQGQSQALQRQLKEQEQKELDLKVSLHSMQMSVLSLWRLAKANQIVLPEDTKKGVNKVSEEKPPQDVHAQLAVVKAYLEDLQVILELAKRATDTEHYLSPLISNTGSRKSAQSDT